MLILLPKKYQFVQLLSIKIKSINRLSKTKTKPQSSSINRATKPIDSLTSDIKTLIIFEIVYIYKVKVVQQQQHHKNLPTQNKKSFVFIYKSFKWNLRVYMKEPPKQNTPRPSSESKTSLVIRFVFDGCPLMVVMTMMMKKGGISKQRAILAYIKASSVVITG